MRQLLPEPRDDVDLAACYGAERAPVPGRPWVLLDMVTSLDGATAVDGRSGGLGGPGDQRVFHALRSLADIILVGAGTFRAERYRTPRLDQATQDRRLLAGQAPLPRIAVVSRSLELDLTAEVFSSDPPPLVVTAPETPLARRAEIAQVADLLLAGHGEHVDLAAALGSFAEMDAQLVVCEGGPHLNGLLLAADLVDELCLTLSPVMVGGDSARVAAGSTGEIPRGFSLAHLLEDDGELYLRAVRER